MTIVGGRKNDQVVTPQIIGFFFFKFLFNWGGGEGEDIWPENDQKHLDWLLKDRAAHFLTHSCRQNRKWPPN